MATSSKRSDPRSTYRVVRRSKGRARVRGRALIGWSLAAFALLAIVLLLVMSQQNSTPGGDLHAATTAFDANDFATATTELKALLRHEPNNAAARLLLGRIHLLQADPQSAAKELEIALQIGPHTDEILQLYVQAQIEAGALNKATRILVPHADSDEPNWVSLHGMVDAMAGRYAEAAERYEVALKADPTNKIATRGLIRLKIVDNDRGAAREYLEQALTVWPSDAEFLRIKGQMDLREQRYAEAKDAFIRALEVQPKVNGARLGLMNAYIGLADWDAAEAQLNALGKTSAENVELIFYRALIAQGRGHSQQALELVEKALVQSEHHERALRFGMALAFQQANYKKARKYAERLLGLHPHDRDAQSILTRASFASGKLDGMLDALKERVLDVEQQRNPRLLALLGAGYLQDGAHAQSLSSLERAYALAPNDRDVRLQLALTKLAGGDQLGGISDLRELSDQSSEDTRPDKYLILAYLEHGDHEQALANAIALMKRSPKDPATHNLLGVVYEVRRDHQAALDAYESALGIDPISEETQRNIARLEAAQGNTARAREIYQQMLKNNAYSSVGLVGLAELAVADGEVHEAIAYLEKARAANRDAVEPRLQLARLYRGEKSYRQAQAIAREAYEIAGHLPEIRREYASAVVAGGDVRAGLPILRMLVERAPSDISLLGFLMRAQATAGATEDVENTATKILTVAPQNITAHAALARLALRRNDHAAALERVRILQQIPNGSVQALELKGDVFVAQDKRLEAREAYASAFEQQPSGRIATKLAKLEELAVGNERLERWLAQHPKDDTVRMIYASRLLATDRSAAIAQFETMTRDSPNNAVPFNNLAWLYDELKNPRSLEMAEQAHSLAPNDPEILDTLGWMLVKNGKYHRAVALLSKAADVKRSDPNIKYHLAVGLMNNGEITHARELLAKLLADEHELFSNRSRAEALYQELQR